MNRQQNELLAERDEESEKYGKKMSFRAVSCVVLLAEPSSSI